MRGQEVLLKILATEAFVESKLQDLTISVGPRLTDCDGIANSGTLRTRISLLTSSLSVI